MSIEPGELMFWIFITGVTSVIGYMWYDLNKKKEKKS